MPLIEHIISLYAPHRCLGCDAEEDTLLCEGCAATVPRVPSRCYKCRAVTKGSETCKKCQTTTPLKHVYVAAHYDDQLVRHLLRATKYERAQAGVRTMTMFMLPTLPSLATEPLLVAVPTATSRVRQRGYDQAVLLTRQLKERAGLQSVRLLARIGQAHQVGAGRAERLKHLQGSFRPVHINKIRGAHILLVDDVLTTGATLETAARVLKKAGAKQIDAVVLAQAG